MGRGPDLVKRLRASDSYPRVDLAGRRFGMILVVGDEGIVRLRNGRRARMWACRCDCGAEASCSQERLVAGRAKTCGCGRARSRKGADHPNWTGSGDLPGAYWSCLVTGARLRSIPMSLTVAEAAEAFAKQGGRCALTGLPLSFQRSDATASLDRIDSSKPYELGNIQWVHKTINLMKNALPQAEFVAMCAAVAKHRDSLALA